MGVAFCIEESNLKIKYTVFLNLILIYFKVL